VSTDAHTLTVFVEPYHSVTLTDHDVGRLVAKLGQIEKVLGFPGAEGRRGRDRADHSRARKLPRRRVQAGERTVRFLRALDELRVERPLGATLVRLRDALLDQVGPSARTYQLELHQADGSVDRSQVFYSYSGAYLVGERLPLLPDGDCWEVEVAKQPDPKPGRHVILSLGACRLYGEPTRIFKVCGLRREWNGPRSDECSGERGEDAHVGIGAQRAQALARGAAGTRAARSGGGTPEAIRSEFHT
jgi:hypothetical protein